MLPFVRNADDLITLRKELMADNMDYIRIFAKIESIEGVEHLPSLLPFCDEIVIARGDLGNAIPLPKLPAVQKGSPQRASMQKNLLWSSHRCSPPWKKTLYQPELK